VAGNAPRRAIDWRISTAVRPRASRPDLLKVEEVPGERCAPQGMFSHDRSAVGALGHVESGSPDV
jgi:hypothetical protein